MKWEIKPEEYRYILGDFVRSGIHIKYEKINIMGNPSIVNIDGRDLTLYPESKTIFFPYITGRQYQVYKEYHFVSSENDSWEYRILSEVDAGDFEDYDIELFRDWDFFCAAFCVNESLYCNKTDYCYAFIFDYKVRFLDFPIKSQEIIENDMFDKQELLDTLEEIGICGDGDSLHFDGNNPSKYINNEDIQKNHIFELYENYIKQKPLYPLNMSLEWFYLIDGQRLNIDTILKSVSPINIIHQDDLMTNYVIDYFPRMSEDEIIHTFKSIRDRYAIDDNIKKEEWYAHTSVLMDEILNIKDFEHIAPKVRKVRSFCNNRGVNLYETSSSNIPHFKNILSNYKKSVEKIYHALTDSNYLDEETRLSDFKYYLTGELESEIQSKIFWKKSIVEFVEFLAYISGDEGEWTIASQIVLDKKGKSPTAGTLKQSISQSSGAHRETFAQLF